ncbi:pseudouridine synthase [Chenggangzhangella methanolivorans]|uniref:Pseudouridine synthase n=1 Tax=Chenggangzhangella methanolivorans TaxID=1437009 RepID=A0A9E6RC06_9HYPH|nr:pseudouridine synthase [Chenggangzhangella methanolivorans]QZO01555.1 pseudouridine synthase [Chenggangzhangella methanolivorans]
MTGSDDTPAAPTEDAAPDDAQANAEENRRRPGERLAKAIARAGLGSRREAEAWIEQGRVAVNGETIASPNHNVEPGDRVEVDGRPLPERERTRLWLYHKPRGYVTTTHDPEGRETVFSILPESMPRVMTVGRLDINTEGLLLLTNDGGLARVLELPDTGWLRRYRVRAFGKTDANALGKLKEGVEIDGFAYGAIDAEIERQQKDNVWLRFGLREGKNREVKRVAEHLGLAVNRLIRISFGPFQLGELPEGAVEEVRTRTLIDQLGKRLTEEAGCDFDAPVFGSGEDAPRKTGGRGSAGRSQEDAQPERRRVMDPSQRVGRRASIARPRDMAAPTSAGDAQAPETRTKRAAPVADRRGRQVKVERVTRTDPEAAPKRFRKKDAGAAERFGAAGRPPRPEREERKGPGKAGGKGFARGAGDRPGRGFGGADGAQARPPRGRDAGERFSRGDGDRPRRAPEGERPRRDAFERRPREDAAERPARAPSDRPRVSTPRWRDDSSGEAARERPSGPRPPRGDRPQREDRPQRGRPEGDRPRGQRPQGDRPSRPQGDRPPRDGDRPQGDRKFGDRKFGDRPPRAEGDRPGRPPAASAARGRQAPRPAPAGRPGCASAGRPASARRRQAPRRAGVRRSPPARRSSGAERRGPTAARRRPSPEARRPSGRRIWRARRRTSVRRPARPEAGRRKRRPEGAAAGGGAPKGGGKGRPGGADRRR